MTIRLTLVAAVLALILTPLAGAQTTAMTGPVENGNFEGPFVPPVAYEPLEGSAADTCIGVGHQVFFGPGSAAGEATGGKAGKPSPSDADPQAGAEEVTDDPTGWAEFQSGYGHCVYEPKDRGVDVAWIEPVDRLKTPMMWSVHPFKPSTDFGYTFDDDPFDREARFLPENPDQPHSNHNLWQSYVSQPGVYTANFEELRFNVEAGAVPDGANIKLSLSGTPLDGQSPYLAGYQDCILTFDDANLAPDADGTVRTDPLEGELQNDGGDAEKYCKTAVNTFNNPDATEKEKRDALGRLRIVQISFRGFNVAPGETPVVVDDVAMPGATTVAEEAAEGNVNQDVRFNPNDV